MDLYETLGVDKGAKPDDIKKKYRKKAQETHPDRPSGDLEMFQQIQLAYDTLSDPYLREKYDTTGTVGRAPTLDEEAQGFLVSVFDHVLSLSVGKMKIMSGWPKKVYPLVFTMKISKLIPTKTNWQNLNVSPGV